MIEPLSAVKRHNTSPLVSQAFKPSTWLANIDFIKMLLTKEHLLLVLMSEPKGGKTTFIDLLRSKVEPPIKTVLFSVDKNEPHKTLEDLYTLFEVKSTSLTSATLIATDINKAFTDFFVNIAPCKQSLFIIIDNAQYFSYEYLYALLDAYKRYGKEKLIHLCLSSDASINDNLKRLNEIFNQFIHTIEPGKLSKVETKTFLLRYAKGHKGLNMLLSEGGFKSFYALTQGEIAAIHKELNLLNQSNQDENKMNFLPKFLPYLLMATFVVFIAIGIQKVIQEKDFYIARMYTSYISPYYKHAKMQHLAEPPLAKFSTEEEEPYLESKLAVIDKVLVIPDVNTNVEIKASVLVPIPKLS